jgi:hypothetical protein
MFAGGVSAWIFDMAFWARTAMLDSFKGCQKSGSKAGQFISPVRIDCFAC